METPSGKIEPSESLSCALSSNISVVSSNQPAQTESSVGRLKDRISQWRLATNSFWPGLGLPRPKAIVVIPQNQPLPKHLRKKTSKSAKHACHYATKERPVKITMYLGLDIIIKIKFTTIFDRCAILNVLNYLTKNFES